MRSGLFSLSYTLFNKIYIVEEILLLTIAIESSNSDPLSSIIRFLKLLLLIRVFILYLI